MKVQAAPGLLCPTEENPREYISDSAPVEVEASAYYLRLLSDGSLVEAPVQVKPDKKGVTTNGE